MPDLLQPGPVLSLPLLATAAGPLDSDLVSWTRERPLALLLPCHVRDLHSSALDGIIATLTDVPWVTRIVVGLDGADEAQLAAAAEKFRPLQPRLALLSHPGAAGKGLNLQRCAAHAMAGAGVFAIAMHDCDIAGYSREFLARLCWPVLHPDAGLAACKGCYARSAGGLHGRVFRLLFQPLLRAWAELRPSPWTAFLQSLRYPLSGELCVRADVLRRMEFAPGWGVEITLLHSLFRGAGAAHLCQAELCSAYDHKHQAPSELVVMAAEVAGALRDSMHAEGCAADPAALHEACARHTARAVRDSLLTARINGISLSADSESALAAAFLAAAFPSAGPPMEVTVSSGL